MEEKEFDKKKAHQSRHSGRKAEKKASKKTHHQEQTAKERNPKAFAFQSAVKAQRRFVRSQDIKSKKHHLPVIDRTPLEPPPVVVAVVGGPKVGKSTLLQCLIKNYTRQRLSSIMGPVTIVAGKKRRLTFIEVNNDVNSMIDIAKVADIVLMLIDATFGIEMETFEFLEICRAHGTPRIMGVLNHLDMFKDNKALKKKKKTLKQRFQVELYPGAKLFYLSGLVHGEYLKNEIKNLGRFISVMKFRPLTWRSTHPYAIVDRIEDITNPESVRTNPKCDRDVVLYGYVRGVPFQRNQRVHIPGCGDFQIKEINFLADPCPLPEHQKKRSLNEKERLTYAPMSGVGGIVYDKDAVYIDLGGSHHGKKVKDEGSDSEDENKGHSIFQPLLDLQKTGDEKRALSQIQLFSNTKLLKNESDEDIGDEDDDENESESEEENEMEVVDSKQSKLNSLVHKKIPAHETVTDSTGRVRRKAIFHDDLEKEDDDDDNDNDDDDDDDDDDDSESEDGEDEYDDEIENESNGEKSEDDNMNDLEPPVKKKKMVASTKKTSPSGENSDSEDYDLEGDLNRLRGENLGKTVCEVKKSKLKVSNSTEKENISIKNKDVEVTMKIQGLLDKLNSKPTIKKCDKPRTISGDSGISESEESDSNESESDDDNMQVTTNDNSFDNRENRMEDGGTSEGSSEDDDDDDNDDDDDDDDDDATLGYRSEMFKQATDNFYKNQSTVSYLRKYIYGEVVEEENGSNDDDSEEVGGLFRRSNKTKQTSPNSSHGLMEAVDTSRYNPTHLRNWADEDLLESIRDCFVTGEWKESENASALLKMDDEDEDLFGDFEDLETGKKFSSEEMQKGEENNGDEINEGEAPEVKAEEKTAKQKRLDKKRRLKEMFDAEYDDKGDNEYFDSLKTEMSQQAQLNREEFEQMDDEQRVQYEGYRPGMYVRMEFSRMPCEFITHFDATYPIVVGGLLDNEQKMGFIRVRIKVHRWYPKILKNKDPLILSLGWRRFQTLMYYAKREDDFRMRSLKYARKYLHVEGMFWGPLTPISSGFVALQNITDRVPDFRIAANGVILETDQSTKICKKLKLIGHPEKILKKTAFIKEMFSSETEIAKFEGAKVQTQSGIRGLIKKAKGREGIFRATFEDVIKLSDVIIFKTWAPVTLTKYCSSVRTLLLPAADKAKWMGMRTVGEIKKEKNIRNLPNPDSMYTKITERREYVPLPLKVPKELQQALPYNVKPKITPRVNKAQRVVVVKDPHEVKMDNFMKRLKTMMEDRIERDESHKQAQKTKYQSDIADREHMRQMRERRKKAAACRYKSKKDGKKNKVL